MKDFNSWNSLLHWDILMVYMAVFKLIQLQSFKKCIVLCLVIIYNIHKILGSKVFTVVI